LAEAHSLYELEAFPSLDARLSYLNRSSEKKPLIHRMMNRTAPLNLTEVNILKQLLPRKALTMAKIHKNIIILQE
jgi:hypothetical protein